jgi:positive regulator of sigma E activity
LLRAAVICYLFPALLLLAGGVAGSFVLAGARDLGALAGGIVGLLLGSFVLRRYDSQSAGLSVRYRAGLLAEQGTSGEP